MAKMQNALSYHYSFKMAFSAILTHLRDNGKFIIYFIANPALINSNLTFE